MGLPTIEEQLRSYGEDATVRESAGSLIPSAAVPGGTSEGASRRSMALVAALVVFILGLSVVAFTVGRSDSSPAAVTVDRNDRATIASYIAEASRALGGLEVGDPCPTWDQVDVSGLRMVPAAVGIPGDASCQIVAWTPRGIPGLSEEEDHFDQDGSLEGSATPVTTAVSSGDFAIIRVTSTPPDTVPAGMPWRIVIEGDCVDGMPGSRDDLRSLPLDACASSTVAVVRGPGEREVLSSGGIDQLSTLGGMPAPAAGETQSFHLLVVDSSGNASYRLPAQGDYVVTGR